MDRFEYKVVPAPMKGRKARGVRRAEDKFAFSVQEVMNDMALEGWEYQRSETLPHEERSGLTSTSTTYRSVLVFRRPKESAETVAPTPIPAPAPTPELPSMKDVTPEDAEIIDVDEDDGFFTAAPAQAPKPGVTVLPAALRQRAAQKQANDDIAAE